MAAELKEKKVKPLEILHFLLELTVQKRNSHEGKESIKTEILVHFRANPA